MENASKGRLIAISNRLPIVLVKTRSGWMVKPGSGGLVTALAPVLRNRGGIWIGWCGCSNGGEIDDILKVAHRHAGYSLHSVALSEEDIRDYYYGFSNEIIWPLFHDLQTRCTFKPQYWHSYCDVNMKFADVVARYSTEQDYLWVHDYHLMLLAHALKEKGVRRKIAFFLHIPFPTTDIFMKLPWRLQVLNALLEYDLIGFQTQRDRRHFIRCLKLLGQDMRIRGRGGVVNVIIGERQVRVGAFPISIDYKHFVERASSREVADAAWYLHEALPDRQVILGIDRLDYTKGIPERLEAFRNALRNFPELQEKVTLVQVVVPSREEVAAYQVLKAEIERLVGEINGEFTRSGWVPIHYLYRSLDQTELLAYYRLAEIGLITPLKDGMNLVAKEYCACNLEENGVLILSEFAGAAAQLHRGAIMVNPYDVEGVSSALHMAFSMNHAERKARMKKLRRRVRNRDIFWWVNNFLKAFLSKDLHDFPEMEDYLPDIQELSDQVL